MLSLVMIELPWRDPAQVLSGFADEPFAVGLMSGGQGARARWSYVARDPESVVSLAGDDDRQPLMALRGLLRPATQSIRGAPPFQGGLIGLACYELGSRFEPLSLRRMAGWPDLEAGLYWAFLAFDHERRRVLAVGRGEGEAAARAQSQRAAAWHVAKAPPESGADLVPALNDDPAGPYEAAVAEVIERIGAGEIFQANIARRWRWRMAPGRRPYDLVLRLLGQSPAPFAAYLRLAGRAVVSNSPERFIAVRPDNGGFHAETRPIKGTRPRGRNAADDRRLAAELLASHKDRAENLMIVDLMRNDLSRSADRVETTGLFDIESFANVHHLVSTVEAKLRPGLSGLDAFLRAYPPGSITGAPKVQAMKVIAALEPPRGPYCGSMFWAGVDGALDSSVLIRTAVFDEDKEGWRVEARAGAGIVADSVPAEEARETEAKIAAIAGALAGAP
jgi:para-aminobenzoate synthetase component 1